MVQPVHASDPLPATRLGGDVRRVLTRQALPPGRHTFLVRGEGFHDAVAHVDVIADAVAEAVVTLFPR